MSAVRLIGHLLAKDLRSLRWLALGWALFWSVILLHFRFSGSGGPEGWHSSFLTTILSTSTLFSLLFVALLSVLLGYSDPAGDLRAFWRTRPISPGFLFAEKLLGLVLLCLIPVVIGLPWCLSAGGTAQAHFSGARQTFTMHLLVGLCVLPLAVRLRLGREQVGRQVLIAILVLCVFIALCGWLSSSSLWFAQPDRVKSSRILLAGSLVYAFFLLDAWLQYRRTKSFLGNLVVLFGLGAGFVCLAYAPWSLPQSLRGPDQAQKSASVEVVSVEPVDGQKSFLGFLHANLKSSEGATVASGSVEGEWREGEVCLPVSGWVHQQAGGAHFEALRNVVLGKPNALDHIPLSFSIRTKDTEAYAALMRNRRRASMTSASVKLVVSSVEQSPFVLVDLPLQEEGIATVSNYHIRYHSGPSKKGTLLFSFRDLSPRQEASIHLFVFDQKRGTLAEAGTGSSISSSHLGVKIREGTRQFKLQPGTKLEDLRVVAVSLKTLRQCRTPIEAEVPIIPPKR